MLCTRSLHGVYINLLSIVFDVLLNFLSLSKENYAGSQEDITSVSLLSLIASKFRSQ